MATFSEKLKRLRTDMEKKQIDIATILGVSIQSYSSYENGREPNYDTLIKLAKYFNCSTDYLLGLSDVRTPEADVRVVCEYTGLSEISVRILNHYRKFTYDSESPWILAYSTRTIDELIKDLGIGKKGYEQLPVIQLIASYFKFSGSDCLYALDVSGEIDEYIGEFYLEHTGILLTNETLEAAFLSHIQQSIIELKRSVHWNMQ